MKKIFFLILFFMKSISFKKEIYSIWIKQTQQT